MPAKQDKIAVRAVVSLLAVLLALAPVTQGRAQAAQQEQESPARETSKPEVIRFPTTLFPVTDWEVGIPPVTTLESDKVPLVRPEAANLFPITDSPTPYDSATAVAPAAAIAISTAGWVAIAIAVVVIAGVLIFIEPG